ncbi:MAG TPA: RNA polymerase sigma factor [Anaeromyxobacteraceae bacterium]|nr:RNA polymerase sigma factor [Anaeromyxobacteraceae bacterium]
MPERGVDLDSLLAQRAWLQRLAVALASDASEAEDLAQETWLVALRSPPRSVEAVRLWLRQVLKNRLRADRRGQRRREAREQQASDSLAMAEDPEQLVARMELHRRVAGHMASLDEPIRQVLFLRFVDGLEPVEVARLLGIPSGTARWRLKRGLDELRRRLDDDAGGRREHWLLVLLPATHPGAVGRLSISGKALPGGSRWSAFAVRL